MLFCKLKKIIINALQDFDRFLLLSAPAQYGMQRIATSMEAPRSDYFTEELELCALPNLSNIILINYM